MSSNFSSAAANTFNYAPPVPVNTVVNAVVTAATPEKKLSKGRSFPRGSRTIFLCAGCKQYMRGPVWMCRKGHNCCSKCVNKGEQDKCSSCGNAGLYPNEKMGEVIWEMGLPMSCQNHAAGCDVALDTEAILQHELGCEFRTVRCPVLNCYANVLFSTIENHMEKSHQVMADGKWVIFEVIMMQLVFG